MALSKKNAKLFPVDEKNDATVIVPTMGEPELIVECIDRLVQKRAGASIKVVVPCNPLEDQDSKAKAESSKVAAQHIVDLHNARYQTENGVKYEPPVELVWVDMGKPAGWPGAVNAGIKAAKGLAETIIVINDDASVCEGYVAKLSNALNSPHIWYINKYITDPSYANGSGSPIEEFGRIGIVGPVSNYCAGTQQIDIPVMKEMPASQAFELSGAYVLDQFQDSLNREHSFRINNVDFLSGFCMAYSRECLMDLLVEQDGECWLLDPLFGIGGYDDNDICARAFKAGYKLAMVRDCYVHHKGHQTLDTKYPEAVRGLAQGVNFLKKWQDYTQREQKLIACSRTKLFRLEDLHMFRGACAKQGQIGDGLAILFTGNPADVLEAGDFDNRRIDPKDGPWLMACKDASPETIAAESQKRIQQWVDEANTVDGKLTHECPVKVEFWTGEWHELHERNAAIKLAETLNPDWILAFDHDEVIEDRVDRKLFRRLIHHPNPLINMYDFGWLNHWGTPEFHRTDKPWSHGYHSSMRGYRMWRVHNGSKVSNLIPTDMGHHKGLHCGNTPQYGVYGKRVAGVRFRHFGYVSQANRNRKHAFYTELDKNPDPALLGNDAGYDHLINQEGMELSRYHPVNGIEFSMLLHKEGQFGNLQRWLDDIYALADRICLVWTGPEGSNPPQMFTELGEMYGVHWVHEPFNDDLAKCRNAGLEYLRSTKPPGTRWFWTMDDDEMWADRLRSLASIRRMAECTDGWAWMFRFQNFRADGSFNYSEAARMFLLDPEGIMKFSGRVHETVEKSIKHLVANGLHPRVRYMPYDCQHYGLARSPEVMQEKLEKYTKLLEKEIMDNPADVGPWVSMALQFANEGMGAEEHVCLEHAVRVAQGEYLPFKELGNFHLRQAKACFERAQERLAQNHGYYPVLNHINEFLSEFAAPVVKSGLASIGEPQKVEVDLGRLLQLADAAYEAYVAEQKAELARNNLQMTKAGDIVPADDHGSPVIDLVDSQQSPAIV